MTKERLETVLKNALLCLKGGMKIDNEDSRYYELGLTKEEFNELFEAKKFEVYYYDYQGEKTYMNDEEGVLEDLLDQYAEGESYPTHEWYADYENACIHDDYGNAYYFIEKH